MKRHPMTLWKPADVLLWLVLGALLIGSVYVLIADRPEATIAYIQINHHLAYKINLQQDQVLELHEFNPPVKIAVRNKEIGIIENDCPQKICLRMGFIRHSHQTIVCVPKKLLIYIPQTRQKSRADEIEVITG